MISQFSQCYSSTYAITLMNIFQHHVNVPGSTRASFVVDTDNNSCSFPLTTEKRTLQETISILASPVLLIDNHMITITNDINRSAMLF